MESTDRLLAGMFGSVSMRAVFSDRARLQGMLDCEAALARAQAAVGVIPAEAADVIGRACGAEAYDIEALSAEAYHAGNTAIPMVRHLRTRVAGLDAEAARFVHFGATSQDVMDTGLVLQMRTGLGLLSVGLARLSEATAQLAERHRHTLAVARTWMQQALPLTFGHRAAGWLAAVERHRDRMDELAPRVLALQFGGAAGTLAGLGESGLKVAEALGRELELTVPSIHWHTHRDRIAETGNALAMMVGTLGKIARDVSLLMQTEIGEVFEPTAPGRGGSSSMPHKRNPVASAAILAAAVRAPGLAATLLSAMPQEHERGLGNWPSEWAVLPELFQLAGGALEQAVFMLEGLEVDEARMRANLEHTGGLILAEAVKTALAHDLGADTAHALVEEACRISAAEGRHLRDVLAANNQVSALLTSEALEALFDPRGYLGVNDAFINRVLAARNSRKP